MSLTERWYSGPFPPAAVFDELPRPYLDCLIPHGRVLRFEPGEILVRQGELNEWLHVILDGRVGLERTHGTIEHPCFLEQLGPGELLGEYGLVDQLCTPYTARASTAVRTLRFQHLAIAASLYYGFRELVPTFQAALRGRILEASARGAVLLHREYLDPHDESDHGVRSGSGIAHDLPEPLGVR